MFNANIASAQEVFDYVINHLVTQGARSTLQDAIIDCAYHGEGGTKCAVGILIPDDMYNDLMEGCDVLDLVRKFPQACSVGGIDQHVDLLLDLQKLHDAAPVWSWEGVFQDYVSGVARRHNLNVPPVAYKFKIKEKE